jgi:hypothetical protein
MIYQGTFYLFQLGAFTNVALNTSEENRTMRFGILSAMFSLASEKKLKTDFWTNYDSPFLTYVALLLLLTVGLVVLIRVDESESASEEPDSMVGSSVERYWNWEGRDTSFLAQVFHKSFPPACFSKLLAWVPKWLIRKYSVAQFLRNWPNVPI